VCCGGVIVIVFVKLMFVDGAFSPISVSILSRKVLKEGGRRGRKKEKMKKRKNTYLA